MDATVACIWGVAYAFGILGGWGLRGIAERRKQADREMQYLPPFEPKEKTRFINSESGKPTGESAFVHRCPFCHHGYCITPRSGENYLSYTCAACKGEWRTRPRNYVPDRVDDLLRPSETPTGKTNPDEVQRD